MHETTRLRWIVIIGWMFATISTSLLFLLEAHNKEKGREEKAQQHGEDLIRKYLFDLCVYDDNGFSVVNGKKLISSLMPIEPSQPSSQISHGGHGDHPAIQATSIDRSLSLAIANPDTGPSLCMCLM